MIGRHGYIWSQYSNSNDSTVTQFCAAYIYEGKRGRGGDKTGEREGMRS